MKKFVIRSGISLATIAVVIAGAAAFSAYEAHIVNVTAKIDNALSVSVDPIDFGTVFPQEAIDKNLDVALSSSFVSTGRVDDVEYMIRQKPKCAKLADGQNGYEFAQVTENEEGAWVCPQGFEALPMLCPYLSKHETTTDGIAPENDIQTLTGGAFTPNGINAFHGPITGWTMADTLATQVTGRLAKSEQDTSDTWKIDFRAPCFAGQCAQDWASFVHQNNPNANPASYVLPQNMRSQLLGCDLWVEVTDVSACMVQSNTTVVSDTTNTVVETESNAVALTTIHPAWTASIPGATWIWSANPVEPPTTIDNTKTFEKTFTVTGTVGTASLDIATDNFYTVYVNGVQVGSEQGNENNFQSGTQDNYTVTNLVPGSNTIKVVARNKGLDGSTQESNPAGVLYKLTYTTSAPCEQ